MYKAKDEESRILNSVEIIEYVPNSSFSKTIIKMVVGDISISSFDAEESLTERISKHNTLAEIIDGKAEIVINGKSNVLESGQSIVIPAFTPNLVKANERFRMIVRVLQADASI